VDVRHSRFTNASEGGAVLSHSRRTKTHVLRIISANFQLLHSSLLPIDYTAACDTTSTCTTRSLTLCSTNMHRAHDVSSNCHAPPIDEEAPTADAGPSTTTVWMPAVTLTYQHALSASSAPQHRRTQTNDVCLHSTTEADSRN
jgi:hypothetical protein